MNDQPGPKSQFDMTISTEVEPGVHADFASLWHTADTFVLDFASVRRPPFLAKDSETGELRQMIPTRIVSRVKIPPGQVFELMKALEAQLSKWESETGRRPDPDQGLSDPS